MESAGSNKDTRKRREKDRAAERNRKHDSLTMDVDIGRMIGSGDEDEDDNNNSMESDLGESSDFASKTESMNHRNTNQFVLPGKFKEMQHNRVKALDRSSSDQSTGSLLYCKTPTTGGGPSSIHGNSSAGSVPRIIGGGSGSGSGSGSTVVNAPSSAGGMGAGNAALGKSSSLIFPTGVDAAGTDDRLRNDSEMVKVVRTKVNFRLDQCEAVRFPFKKKLLLDNLHLASNDIPMKDLCGTGLGNALHKLSLAKNRLISIPPQLVMSLPVLKTLDISQCELHQLPEFFNLPKLTRLNLSHNLLIDFPDEVRSIYRLYMLYSLSLTEILPNLPVSLFLCRVF